MGAVITLTIISLVTGAAAGIIKVLQEDGGEK